MYTSKFLALIPVSRREYRVPAVRALLRGAEGVDIFWAHRATVLAEQ